MTVPGSLRIRLQLSAVTRQTMSRASPDLELSQLRSEFVTGGSTESLLWRTRPIWIDAKAGGDKGGRSVPRVHLTDRYPGPSPEKIRKTVKTIGPTMRPTLAGSKCIHVNTPTNPFRPWFECTEDKIEVIGAQLRQSNTNASSRHRARFSLARRELRRRKDRPP